MKLHFLFVLLLPFSATAQIIKDNTKGIDPDKMTIDKNIFRVLLSLATDTKAGVMVSYEREIKKPFTFFLKAGPVFKKEPLGTDVYGNAEDKYFFSAMAAGELRYYYNLKRRKRLERTIRNFSGYYFSLEALLISKPLYILNKSGNETLKAVSNRFINIGYQYQKNTTYYNAYFGMRLLKQDYNNLVSGLNLLHGGITIGRAF